MADGAHLVIGDVLRQNLDGDSADELASGWKVVEIVHREVVGLFTTV
jgi:hypothetical protein